MEQVKGKTFVEVPKRNLKGKRESLLFIFEGAAFKRRRNWEREEKMLTEAPVSSLRNGGVAQLGEHLPCTQGVRSSNLLISTKRTLKIEQ